MTKTIRTIRDEIEHSDRVEFLGNSAAVGEICRKGRTLFYAYVNGILTERHTRYELGEMMAAALDQGGRVGA
jgi:hypothetical protein